jgi:hypothetical protein
VAKLVWRRPGCHRQTVTSDGALSRRGRDARGIPSADRREQQRGCLMPLRLNVTQAANRTDHSLWYCRLAPGITLSRRSGGLTPSAAGGGDSAQGWGPLVPLGTDCRKSRQALFALAGAVGFLFDRLHQRATLTARAVASGAKWRFAQLWDRTHADGATVGPNTDARVNRRHRWTTGYLLRRTRGGTGKGALPRLNESRIDWRAGVYRGHVHCHWNFFGLSPAIGISRANLGRLSTRVWPSGSGARRSR